MRVFGSMQHIGFLSFGRRRARRPERTCNRSTWRLRSRSLGHVAGGWDGPEPCRDPCATAPDRPHAEEPSVARRLEACGAPIHRSRVYPRSDHKCASRPRPTCGDASLRDAPQDEAEKCRGVRSPDERSEIRGGRSIGPRVTLRSTRATKRAISTPPRATSGSRNGRGGRSADVACPSRRRRSR